MFRVAVIMAAYNAEKTIDDSIQSIVNQSYTSWSLCVVNDASTDGTAARLQKYENDERICVIHLSDNIGGAGARTVGIAASESEFLAIQDADDIALPNRLALQIAEFDADPELAVVAGQIADFGTWGGPAVSYKWPTSADEIQDRLNRGRSPVADCAAMLRRSSFEEVGGYDPALKRAYDLGLYLSMRDKKFSAVEQIVLHYRTVRPVSFAYCIEEGRYRELAINRHLHCSGPQSYSRFPSSLKSDVRAALVCLLRRWRERGSARRNS